MAWYDGFAAVAFTARHGRTPRPGEDFRAEFVPRREHREPPTPPAGWVEQLADEHAAELDTLEAHMNLRSRVAVRRRRRSING